MTPETFRTIRKQLGLTQTGLANVLRIKDNRTIRKWEAGDASISGPVGVLMSALSSGILTPEMIADGRLK